MLLHYQDVLIILKYGRKGKEINFGGLGETISLCYNHVWLRWTEGHNRALPYKHKGECRYYDMTTIIYGQLVQDGQKVYAVCFLLFERNSLPLAEVFPCPVFVKVKHGHCALKGPKLSAGGFPWPNVSAIWLFCPRLMNWIYFVPGQARRSFYLPWKTIFFSFWFPYHCIFIRQCARLFPDTIRPGHFSRIPGDFGASRGAVIKRTCIACSRGSFWRVNVRWHTII